MKNPFIDADIFMIGFLGESGTKKLIDEYSEKLSERFSNRYLRGVLYWQDGNNAEKNGKKKPQLLKALPHPGSTEEKMMFLQQSIDEIEQNGFLENSLDESGMLFGLWELSRKTCCGFLVDLKEATVHQETIEVCEWLELNPYEIESFGTSLVVVPKMKMLAEDNEKYIEGLSARFENKPIKKIGSLHKEKGKWILRGDIKQCLNRPKRK